MGRDISLHSELPVELAGPVVPHGDLAVVYTFVCVLFMKQAQRDASLRQLPVDVLPVGFLVCRLVVVAVWEEQGVYVIVTEACHILVGDVSLRCGIESVDHPVFAEALQKAACRSAAPF